LYATVDRTLGKKNTKSPPRGRKIGSDTGRVRNIAEENKWEKKEKSCDCTHKRTKE